ncbi:MAG: HAD-IIA family hydrolase [Nocardioidaceae bacterium]
MRPVADGSRDPLVARYDAGLFDLDGVLYRGRWAVPGAAEAVVVARSAGMRVAFVTNNASRTPEAVAQHLTELGIAAHPQDVVTSAQAAATLVAELVDPGSAVLVVGGAGLRAALTDRGLRPVDSAEEGPAAVVQGWAPEVGWGMLAEGTYAVRDGLPWVASNRDVTVPTARGLAPGNGTLVNVIVMATGREPVTAGKPERPLHEEAVRRTGARSPVVVGDRLDTDIEGANAVGVASLLVLTGVTHPTDVVLAPPHRRPTYVAVDLRAGLLRPHPPVERTSGGWTCRGWECSVADGRVRLSGSGDASDGLRAISLACWEAPAGPAPDEVHAAVSQLRL